jgi:hypothetical protein
MIRTPALLFVGLWLVTAVVAEENPIFHTEDLIIMRGYSEDIPMSERVAGGAIHANRTNHLYHLPSCEGYQQVSPADVVSFINEEIATEAGYRRAENCS